MAQGGGQDFLQGGGLGMLPAMMAGGGADPMSMFGGGQGGGGQTPTHTPSPTPGAPPIKQLPGYGDRPEGKISLFGRAAQDAPAPTPTAQPQPQQKRKGLTWQEEQRRRMQEGNRVA